MTNVPQTEPDVNDEIPFYPESEIWRHATNEPIDDYIGDMLKAQRPTPLEEVAVHVYEQVRKATDDLFAAWEAMCGIMAGNGNSIDRWEATVRAEEPWSYDPEPSFFEDEVTA